MTTCSAIIVPMPHRKKRRHRLIKRFFVLLVSVGLVSVGLVALWIATLKMPDLGSFQNRKIIESTKIFDRTGTVLLYDTGKDARRSAVPLSEISPSIQQATIAIEDSNFYKNNGIICLSSPILS